MEDGGGFLDFASEEFKEKLLIASQNGCADPQNADNCKLMMPEPGFCVKTETDKHEKVFINICRSDNIPCPENKSDEELIKLLESDNPSSFRIPLSFGEPHVETDNNGRGCVAYDVVINSTFFDDILKREILRQFILIIALDGLENKYDIQLKRDIKILKNRKSVGTLMQQNIRTSRKPWILEMENENQVVEEPIKEINIGVRPDFKIIQEPLHGPPLILKADIYLPNVETASSLALDIGEDRLLLITRSSAYYLDIFLPFNLNQEKCSAQFDRSTNVLRVTMPVLSSAIS